MNIKQLVVLVLFYTFSQSALSEAAIESKEQKLSYSLGAYFIASVTEQKIKIDNDAFLLAVKDALNGNDPKMSLEEMQKVLTEYRQEEKRKQTEIAEKNKKLGAEFLAKNSTKEGVTVLPSGLQYKVLKAGDGAHPEPNSLVIVHYEGKLIDGTVFDSSYERGEPAALSLQQVIKGWQEAVPLMKGGSKWQIYIPSELAYGERSPGDIIEPGSTLIFDIELIKK